MRVLPYFKEKIITCYLANLISRHVEYVKILNRYNPHVILFRLNTVGINYIFIIPCIIIETLLKPNSCKKTDKQCYC